MALRAFARVIFTAANSPSTTARRGFRAGIDTANGRTTFTLDRPIDRTEGCVLASRIQGSVGTGSPVFGGGGQLSAAVALADTTVEVRSYNTAGTLADPVVGTGFCVAVFDAVGEKRL